MSLSAKTVVKNKFWIVEKNGQQVATIQTFPSGVTYAQPNKREHFVSINLLKEKYNISFDRPKKSASSISHDVNGYPCDHIPYNALFDLSKKLPVYTKTSKSKSFFCAGYYLIKFNSSFVQTYCPKLITLARYEFAGPFPTKGKAKEYSNLLRNMLKCSKP